jgi:hypothetical protein
MAARGQHAGDGDVVTRCNRGIEPVHARSQPAQRIESPVDRGAPLIRPFRILRIAPAFIFALYLLADLFVVILLNPVYSFLRAQGRRNPTIRNIGRRTLAVAMIGTGRLAADEVRAGRLAPALLRIATVGFGVEVYTAGALATGLPIPRLAGWTAAMVGDLLGFALLLGSSIAAAHVFDDERATAAVVQFVALLGPPILRRTFPALRY